MRSHRSSERWVPQYVLLSMIWGASFAFTEAGLEVFSPLGITTVRHTIGALVLLAVMGLGGGLKNLGNVRAILWRKMVLVALLLNVIPGFLFAFAQNHVSTVIASIINSATPILTIVMLVTVFKGEEISRTQIAGVVVGLVGGLLALGVANFELGESEPIGIIAVFAAITCYGFAIPYVRREITPLSSDSVLLAALQVNIAAAVLLGLFGIEILVTGDVASQVPSVFTGVQIAILGLGTGVAYIWHFQVIERAGSAVASSITYPTLLVSLLIGVLILGESMSLEMILGALLIVFGSWITQRSRV